MLHIARHQWLLNRSGHHQSNETDTETEKEIFSGSHGRSRRARNGNQISKLRRYSFKMFKFEINVVVELLSKIIIRERKV